MEEIAQKINEEIKKSLIFKEYVKLKIIMDNNDALISLKAEMENLKNKICKEKNELLVEEYYALEKQYKNSVIVKEYLRSKDELKDLLKGIVDILSVN